MREIIDTICLIVAGICIPTGFVYWLVMLHRGEANAGHWFPWVEPKTPNRFPWEAVIMGVGALAVIVLAVLGDAPFQAR